MNQRSTKPLLLVFLIILLAGTVVLAGFFAAHRRRQVTALGPAITSTQLGFSIRMPQDWDRVTAGMTIFGPGLVYMRPLQPGAGRDSLTGQSPQRHIFFLITAPNATEEQVLTPLTGLVRALDISDNYFHGYQIKWSGDGPPGKYQRRRGVIRVRVYQRDGSSFPIELGFYEQITAANQVFWCVIVGNTRLDAADEALLDAVVASFEQLSGQSQEQPTPEG